jgi:propionate CoA-transferase
MIETEMADVSKSGGSKVISAEEAAALIPDDINLAAPIIGLAGWSKRSRAIAKRYEETGHPKGLTLVLGSAGGNHRTRDLMCSGLRDSLPEYIGAHMHGSPNIGALIQANKMLIYCFRRNRCAAPQEIAAKRLGMLSKVGLGTFVDPRIEGAN